MRARYCAHVLKLIDFIVATYHPSCKAEQEIEEIKSSASLDWQRLDVIAAPTPQGTEGYVEFKAFLQQGNVEHCMHERSRFIKENERWYYIDGVFPQDKTAKLGRNDSCFCGSGKKFKKCCGK
jgi:SEC-C motif-containing protein